MNDNMELKDLAIIAIVFFLMLGAWAYTTIQAKDALDNVENLARTTCILRRAGLPQEINKTHLICTNEVIPIDQPYESSHYYFHQLPQNRTFYELL